MSSRIKRQRIENSPTLLMMAGRFVVVVPSRLGNEKHYTVGASDDRQERIDAPGGGGEERDYS